MVERHKAGDCLREPLVHTLPPRCRQLQQAYGQCKYDTIHSPLYDRADETVRDGTGPERVQIDGDW